MERKIYKEIPGGKSSFHSAVLTTFSFNFHHFEGQVLRTLKEKWITSINVLVDQNMLNSSLGVSSNYLKSINQAYAVNGIKSSGAFHPKINFFIGDSCLLAIFGSGNLTPGGHGKNHEVFSGFYANSVDKTELPLLLELWEYVIGFAKQMDGYSAERICNTITGCCDLFSNKKLVKHQFHNLGDSLDAALLYNEKDSDIYHQLSYLIPTNNIERITIVCPYYDEDGALLKNLCQLFPNAHLDIYLQENKGLPPTQMEADERITFYDFNETTRGKVRINALGDDRMLHAKVFHFKSAEKEYYLTGSVNATLAGMGSPSSPPLNDELCVLYASSSFDFLDSIGINNVGKRIEDISAFPRKDCYGENPTVTDSYAKQFIKIKSIDLEGRHLKVYIDLKHILNEPSYLTAFGQNGVKVFSFPINDYRQKTFEFTLSAEQCDPDLLPQYCAFVSVSGAIISNKQPVNRIDKLRNTNPERNLRTIREIIGKVEAGQFNELEIADYLTQLYREDTGAKRISSYGSFREDKEEIREKDIATLSYDEAIAASRDTSVLSKIVSGHITSRLWESLEHIFDSKSNAISDELMEEEEEASATESKERKVENTVDNGIKLGNDIMRPLSIVRNLTEKYCSNLNKAQFNEEHVIGIVDYLRFLLISHAITAICHFNEYMPFPKDKENKMTFSDWKKSLHSLYKEAILSILKQFTLLHQRRKVAKYGENQDDLIFRHNDLLNKTLYHILLDAAIVYNSLERQEPVVKERIILYCLNIFDQYGLPNAGLKAYLEKLSAANNNAFYPRQVLRMLDEIVNASRDGTYKKAEKSGICKVDSVQDGKYRIKTIYSDSYSFANKKDVSDFTL